MKTAKEGDILSTTAQTHQQDLERLKSLRYMYRGNDEIGKLMHDFSCTNPDDMNYEALAKKARYYKQDKKGVATMCKILEDMRNEAALDNARETARRMIKKGKMSLEEIAEYVPVLSLDELRQLETEIMQMA